MHTYDLHSNIIILNMLTYMYFFLISIFLYVDRRYNSTYPCISSYDNSYRKERPQGPNS